MKFSASWIPGGTIELAELPVKGMRELQAIEMKNVEAKVLVREASFLTLTSTTITCHRLVPTYGAAKCKETWDSTILATQRNPRELIWPLESFEESLRATKERFTRQLGVETDEEAEVKISARLVETSAQLAKLTENSMAQLGLSPLIELYWRLRASGLAAITTAVGEVALDWSLSAKDVTIDLLAEVVTGPDFEGLREQKDAPTGLEDLLPTTVAEAEGKSEAPSGASMTWKPGLEPYSESSTGTESASASLLVATG